MPAAEALYSIAPGFAARWKPDKMMRVLLIPSAGFDPKSVKSVVVGAVTNNPLLVVNRVPVTVRNVPLLAVVAPIGPVIPVNVAVVPLTGPLLVTEVADIGPAVKFVVVKVGIVPESAFSVVNTPAFAVVVPIGPVIFVNDAFVPLTFPLLVTEVAVTGPAERFVVVRLVIVPVGAFSTVNVPGLGVIAPMGPVIFVNVAFVPLISSNVSVVASSVPTVKVAIFPVVASSVENAPVLGVIAPIGPTTFVNDPVTPDTAPEEVTESATTGPPTVNSSAVIKTAPTVVAVTPPNSA